jgi:putative oxidoreductase
MQTTHTAPASYASSDDLAKLVLRASLAIFMLFHGISKVFGGVDFITGLMDKIGMPASFGYLVYVGEVIAPLLVLLGIWTRPAALVIVINMVAAVLLVHSAEIFTLSKTGGWALELQGFFFITAIVVALLGAGRISVGGVSGKWN